MSTAGIADLSLDQGADFGIQIYWTDAQNNPFTVLSPMRMEIKNSVGGIVYALQTDDDAPVDTVQTILYNPDSGLIQLMIPAVDTAKLAAGSYVYDLFITYLDNAVTQATRTKRLIAGSVLVNGKVTSHV
jgi:hypothetical protein